MKRQLFIVLFIFIVCILYADVIGLKVYLSNFNIMQDYKIGENYISFSDSYSTKDSIVDNMSYVLLIVIKYSSAHKLPEDFKIYYNTRDYTLVMTKDIITELSILTDKELVYALLSFIRKYKVGR